MPLRSRERRAAVRTVEAAYSESSSLGVWLDRVVGAARPLLAADLGLIATITRRGTAHLGLEAYAEVDLPFGWVRPSFERACREVPAEHFDPYYEPGAPVRRLDDIRKVLASRGSSIDVGAPFVEHGGLRDLALLVVHPTVDTVLCVASLDRGTSGTRRAELRQLTQVALHLENAARVHLATPEEVAWLSPDGRIVDARTTRSNPDDRERLRDRVRVVERIRVDAARGTETDGLDAWPALVDGTYSLLERTDADGKRHYVAYENPVASRAQRMLTERERSVLELTARGLSGKWIAYTLGVSESAISLALTSAATKLGVGSRTRLVAVASELLGSKRPPLDVALTEGERDVLALITAGCSNEEIAHRRGRSVRTVANQVASLLRKTGARSRRALAAFAIES